MDLYQPTADVHGGIFSLRSSTLTGNTGAGDLFCDSGDLYINNSTVVTPVGPRSSWAVSTDGCGVILDNSYIANEDNFHPTCEFGGGGVWGRSLSADDDGSCGTALTVGDARLGGLNDNGGPTRTLLPAEDSPLVNAGELCDAHDQHDVPRNDGACDIGAVERQPSD